MTVSAVIRFTQNSFVYPAGEAVGNGSTGLAVTCENLGVGTPVSFTWSLLGVPGGSSVPLGVFANNYSPVAYFTPDIRGSYEVELAVADASGVTVTTRKAFMIQELSGNVIPPFKAGPESLNVGGQPQGWTPFMEAWLRALDELIVSGGGGGGSNADVVDNILGNQIVGSTPGSPFLNPGDSMAVVVGALPYKVIPIGLNRVAILRIEARNVVVYHTTAAEVEATIVLPGREKPVGVSFVSSFIWIASNTGKVYKYDAGSHALLATYAGAGPVADTPVAMTQAGGFLFIIKDAGGSYDSVLYRVNMTTGALATHSISAPYGLVTDSLDRVWTGSQQITGNVTVIDPATFAETSAPNAGFNDVRVVLSVGGKMLVYADGTGTCYRYNELVTPTSDGSIGGFPGGGAKAYDVAYDSTNDTAFFVFGLQTYAGVLLTDPAGGGAAGSSVVPLPATSFDTRSVAYSAFDAGFVVLDAYRDRSYIVDYTGATYPTYLELGGLISFVP